MEKGRGGQTRRTCKASDRQVAEPPGCSRTSGDQTLRRLSASCARCSRCRRRTSHDLAVKGGQISLLLEQAGEQRLTEEAKGGERSERLVSGGSGQKSNSAHPCCRVAARRKGSATALSPREAEKRTHSHCLFGLCSEILPREIGRAHV